MSSELEEEREAREREARDRARWEAAEEGAELLREGLSREAIVELEAVILRDPENEYAYFFLGNAHFEEAQAGRGAYDKAMKAYTTALSLAPGYLGAMIGLGHSLRLLGRLEHAIRVGRQALLKSKDDPDALYLLALCCFARDEKKAAEGYLLAFLDTRPEVEVAQEARGLLAIVRGQVDGPVEREP